MPFVLRRQVELALGRDRMGRFRSDVEAWLLASFPERCRDLEETRFRSLANRGIDAAARAGMRSAYARRRIAACNVLLGTDVLAGKAWPAIANCAASDAPEAERAETCMQIAIGLTEWRSAVLCGEQTS